LIDGGDAATMERNCRSKPHWAALEAQGALSPVTLFEDDADEALMVEVDYPFDFSGARTRSNHAGNFSKLAEAANLAAAAECVVCGAANPR
jgi:hypothetical protein